MEKTIVNYNQEQINLITRTIAKGCTPDELKMFIGQCKRTGLDPFSRQIYAVKRWDAKEGREVMTTQTSIDGLRLIAERTGEYEGQTPAMWCGEDGQWVDVWLQAIPPKASKVGVYRKNFKEPLYAVAKFESYAQKFKDKMTGEMKLSPFWAKMPELMIAKVAESLALRKAFPQELSGLYTTEEMPEIKDTQQTEKTMPEEKSEEKIVSEAKIVEVEKKLFEKTCQTCQKEFRTKYANAFNCYPCFQGKNDLKKETPDEEEFDTTQIPF
jgi:phage recombination protein Bet